MQLKLEELEYQKKAIDSVIKIFDGQQKNNFDNATEEGIRHNYLSLSGSDIEHNIRSIIRENGISEEKVAITNDNDYCIEMETGTGKTLVYLRTIYELFDKYGFTKFIILVPSVAIKKGILTTLDYFKDQLGDIYGFKPDFFEYDSKNLQKVINFIEYQTPQIMIMTLQSFNSDDRILNQQQRENLFSNLPYIEAIGKTKPIIIMDEPQEGMDTENSINRIKSLNPICKLRYSATHKEIKNLVYRLTPFESYKQGLVKKIEVLSVAEKNDEATLKIEVSQVRTFTNGKGPQVKLKAWRYSSTNKQYEFKETPWIKEGDDLEEKTKNVCYQGYKIVRIYKNLRDRKFKVEFSNGIELIEGEQSKDFTGIFREQLHWLIKTHFDKKELLKEKNIKPLSLVFIDKVDNYISEDGVIRNLFIEEYSKIYKEKYGVTPTEQEVTDVQGYYFAKTQKGEFTDSQYSMSINKEIYNLILNDKKKLLSFSNPVEFIFSHSALGVGWDNPNVFNIATLNQSYNENKKRQEIGRGLRIAVNQEGERVYDSPDTIEGEEINLLTVIPNETYESFVSQYQEQIKEAYGTTDAGAETRQNHKGKKLTEKTIKRNDNIFDSDAFKDFWSKLSKKTDYVVSFDENSIIEKSVDILKEVIVSSYEAEVSLNRITTIKEDVIENEYIGSDSVKLKAVFTPIDIVKELSENTSLSVKTVLEIITKLNDYSHLVKNPYKFLQEATGKIKNIVLDEMLRTVVYKETGDSFDIQKFIDIEKRNTEKIVKTPNKSLYDHIVWDSLYEKEFASEADKDSEVVCFLKLPSFYKIQTPIGPYNPDFGLVMKKRSLRNQTEDEFYFVVETKGTNDINDKAALTDSEIYKIKCAIKHFESLGVKAEIHYKGPIKEFRTFKNKFEVVANGQY